MMKKSIPHVGLILLTFVSFGQVDYPKEYCQDCCEYYVTYLLKLDNDNTFEILWEDKVYGSGTYEFHKDVMTLDVNSSMEKFEIRKLRDSDSLIINFDIRESIHLDSAIGTEVHLRNQNNHSFLYHKGQGTLTAPFENFELLRFHCLGYGDLEYRINTPGEYQMKVMLTPYMKMDIKKDDVKRLRVIRSGSIWKFRDLDDGRIKFTTKKCKRI